MTVPSWGVRWWAAIAIAVSTSGCTGVTAARSNLLHTTTDGRPRSVKAKAMTRIGGLGQFVTPSTHWRSHPGVFINHTPLAAEWGSMAETVAFRPRIMVPGLGAPALVLAAQRLPAVVARLSAFRTPILCSLVYGMGDMLAQHLERRGTESPVAMQTLDARRLANSGLIGFMWAGYVTPLVYGFADRAVPGISVVKVIRKTCISIGILGTAGNYVNMATRRLLAGELPAAAMAHVNADFAHVVVEDLRVWPAYDACVYAFVPITVRPYCNAVAACLWSSYISVVSNKVA